MKPLRVLFVTPYVPSSLRPRPYNFIRALAERGNRISLLALSTSAREQADGSGLAQYCEQVRSVHVPWVRSVCNCLAGLPTQDPMQVCYCDSPAARRWLRMEVNGYDLLHVEHLRAARFGLDIGAVPRVFDAVDCISSLLARAAGSATSLKARIGARFDLKRTRVFESSLCRRFDRVLVSSESDRQDLQALAGSCRADEAACRAPVSVVPHGVDVEHFHPSDRGREAATLVYVGRLSYHANVAAVSWLLREIMPSIWKRRPEARLLLVGADPPRAIRSAARRCGERVQVTGYVPDVRPYLARATISVNPLVYAVGTQNKILEAMAMAMPVVTTAAGAGSLGVRDREHLAVASRVSEFADKVVTLLGDRAAQTRLGQAAREYVVAHLDSRTIARRLETIYDEAIAEFRRRAPVR